MIEALTDFFLEANLEDIKKKYREQIIYHCKHYKLAYCMDGDSLKGFVFYEEFGTGIKTVWMRFVKNAAFKMKPILNKICEGKEFIIGYTEVENTRCQRFLEAIGSEKVKEGAEKIIYIKYFRRDTDV